MSKQMNITLGYIFQFMGGSMSWRSRLQECIALFTTKGEFVAPSEACKGGCMTFYISL